MAPTMELTQMEIAQTQIQPCTPPNPPPASVSARIFTRTLTLAFGRLEVFRHSAVWGALLGRTGYKRKQLSVRETAALGDRRFVSVIQFESQRFLIGSSPSAITLLAQLPDEPSRGEETGEQGRKESRGN